jgi:hypothetical protein
MPHHCGPACIMHANDMMLACALSLNACRACHYMPSISKHSVTLIALYSKSSPIRNPYNKKLERDFWLRGLRNRRHILAARLCGAHLHWCTVLQCLHPGRRPGGQRGPGRRRKGAAGRRQSCVCCYYGTHCNECMYVCICIPGDASGGTL